MKITTYIIRNWEKLPKSSFNNVEFVIFFEEENYDGGYGHHTYRGYGVDVDGNIFKCTSSGCSCNGNAFADPAVMPEGKFDWKDINFSSLEVHFSDY